MFKCPFSSEFRDAKEIREDEYKRAVAIENILKCKVIVVWESDYKKNKSDVIENTIKLINIFKRV